ncbi:MAG: M55 family metallopeptidase [Planctomycetota bacterium]|nr:M55 family metallopeptidase [Planctomycetota bacterium]
MKVYILSDMEGTACVTTWDQVSAGTEGYEEARFWLTAEVNAAAAGAFDTGAKFVLVNDGHGDQKNLLHDELDPRIEVIQGKGRSMWEGLDNTFGAFFQVGAHSRAGTPEGNLRHVWSADDWIEVRIDGEAVGEIALFARGAAQRGVPCVFVTGDDKACAEAAACLAGVETAQVKTGLGVLSARTLTPAAACRKIRQHARKACRQAASVKPLEITGETHTVEIFRLAKPEGDCYAATLERDLLDALPRTVQAATAPTIIEAFELALKARPAPAEPPAPLPPPVVEPEPVEVPEAPAVVEPPPAAVETLEAPPAAIDSAPIAPETPAAAPASEPLVDGPPAPAQGEPLQPAGPEGGAQ